jgi:hypothetical protein
MVRYKYPKLTILTLSFVLAYLFFTSYELTWMREAMRSMGLFGSFIAGVFYVYGFLAPIATATFLIIAKDQPFLLTGLIGGLGAVIGDLIIFRLIRHDFMDEMRLLADEKIIARPRAWLGRKIHAKLKGYFLPIIGAFIIASPLPDELGVVLIAGSSKISQTFFTIASYCLNTIGILTILYIGTLI